MLLWLAGLLGAGVVAVLLLPVRVDVDLNTDPEPMSAAIRTRIRWLWFCWRPAEGRRRPTSAGPAGPHDEVAMSPRRRGPINILAALRTPGFPGRCAQLLREIRHALRPRQAIVRARIGLDDPFETGLLAGVLAATAGLSRPRAFDLEITPDFSGAVVGPRTRGLVTPASRRVMASLFIPRGARRLARGPCGVARTPPLVSPQRPARMPQPPASPSLAATRLRCAWRDSTCDRTGLRASRSDRPRTCW